MNKLEIEIGRAYKTRQGESVIIIQKTETANGEVIFYGVVRTAGVRLVMHYKPNGECLHSPKDDIILNSPELELHGIYETRSGCKAELEKREAVPQLNSVRWSGPVYKGDVKVNYLSWDNNGRKWPSGGDNDYDLMWRWDEV